MNTRIAPSPTGNMHLGTLRTAYFCYLAARATGGYFYVRIDDTDTERNKPEHVNHIFDTLDWLGLESDGVYTQSRRLHVYRHVVGRMVALGMATEDGAGAVTLTSADGHIPSVWNDTIIGEVEVTDHDREVIDGMVIMKTGGLPTYHLATAVDDFCLPVDRVIRGHDHISNTAKQLTLMKMIGQIVPGSIPEYTHVGLLHFDGKKLSKRDGDPRVSIQHYRDEGIDPDAMLNFLLRLGWAESDGKTIKRIPKDMAIEIFLEKGKMRNQSSTVDPNLLASYDRKYKATKK